MGSRRSRRRGRQRELDQSETQKSEQREREQLTELARTADGKRTGAFLVFGLLLIGFLLISAQRYFSAARVERLLDATGMTTSGQIAGVVTPPRQTRAGEGSAVLLMRYQIKTASGQSTTAERGYIFSNAIYRGIYPRNAAARPVTLTLRYLPERPTIARPLALGVNGKVYTFSRSNEQAVVTFALAIGLLLSIWQTLYFLLKDDYAPGIIDLGWGNARRFGISILGAIAITGTVLGVSYLTTLPSNDEFIARCEQAKTFYGDPLC